MSICSLGGPITADALDLTIQGPYPWTWDITVQELPPPTGRRHIVAKTGDLLKPRSSDIWWLLKYVLFASRRYSSYWNAFLFFFRKGPVRECVKYSSFSLHFYLVRSHM